jgi:hypothetical protein
MMISNIVLLFFLCNFAFAEDTLNGQNIKYSINFGKDTMRDNLPEHQVISFILKYSPNPEFTLFVYIPNSYGDSTDQESFLRNVSVQLQNLDTEIKNSGLLKSDILDADYAHYINHTFKAKTVEGQPFTSQPLLSEAQFPLEPHLILQSHIEGERVDTLSSSLNSVALLSNCQLARYPHNNSDQGFVYGTWCPGESSLGNDVVISVGDGFLSPSHRDLLPSELDMSEVTLFSYEAGTQLAWENRDPENTVPQPPTVPTNEESDTQPVNSDGPDEKQSNLEYIIIGCVSAFILLFWMTLSSRAKKRKALVQKMKKTREESEF